MEHSEVRKFLIDNYGCKDCDSIILFSNRSTVDRVCKTCVIKLERDQKINKILTEQNNLD